MAESLDEEMVATYGVTITGVERTKSELARLSEAIQTLRRTQYQENATVTQARFGTSRSDRLLGGRKDIFAASVDQLEGRVQSGVQKALASGMAYGRKAQIAALRAAETKTGKSGKPAGRKSAGREVTGALINAIATNVETEKTKAVTKMVGWHGWPGGPNNREKYFAAQERGSKGRPSGQQPGSLRRKVKKRDPEAAPGRGVPAANSLGAAIVLVREQLKRELGKLKR
jgi:hypothetical protein